MCVYALYRTSLPILTLLKEESLANANVKRATAVHVWTPLSKKSKLSQKSHGWSKHHVSISYAANANLPMPG